MGEEEKEEVKILFKIIPLFLLFIPLNFPFYFFFLLINIFFPLSPSLTFVVVFFLFFFLMYKCLLLLLLVSGLSFPGYKCFHKYGKHKKGGGVICYVNCTLPAIKIDKQNAENYDSVCVDITANNTKLTLATVYRPQKQPAAYDIALYEELHFNTKQRAILIGDFNCLETVDWR